MTFKLRANDKRSETGKGVPPQGIAKKDPGEATPAVCKGVPSKREHGGRERLKDSKTDTTETKGCGAGFGKPGRLEKGTEAKGS